LTLVSGVVAVAETLVALPVETANVVVLAGTNNSTTLYYTPTKNANMTARPTHTMPPADAVALADAATTKSKTTTTKRVQVIATSRPSDPQPIIILPFHLSTTSHCTPDATLTINGTYKNGDWVQNFSLHGANTAVLMPYHVPGLPNTFRIGPYDYDKGFMQFGYENKEWKCGWADDESGKVCGECKAKEWSGDGVGCQNCKGEEGGMCRVREVDCSFVLGWESELLGAARPVE